MELSRRQLLRGTSGCLVGPTALAAGCSSGGRDVQLRSFAVYERVNGIEVDVGFGNNADEAVDVLTRAELSVGNGDSTETYSLSKRATLPANRRQNVVLAKDPGETGHEPTDSPIDAEVWAEFPNSNRDPIEHETCKDCE